MGTFSIDRFLRFLSGGTIHPQAPTAAAAIPTEDALWSIMSWNTLSHPQRLYSDGRNAAARAAGNLFFRFPGMVVEGIGVYHSLYIDLR